MVSFTCHRCQDVVKKPKVRGHASLCGGNAAIFSCVDCMQVFDLQTVKGHTSCVTETQKYQGQWLQKRKNAEKTALPQLGRHPRPTMDDLSDSDSDGDDDWINKKKSEPHTMDSAHTNKRARSEEMDNARKTFRTDSGPDAAASQSASVEDSSSLRKSEFIPSLPSCADGANNSPYEVESFVLGSRGEVHSIIANILQSEGTSSGDGCISMQKKSLAKALVGRYSGRIAKHLLRIVNDAVQESMYLSNNSNTTIMLNEEQFELQKSR